MGTYRMQDPSVQLSLSGAQEGARVGTPVSSIGSVLKEFGASTREPKTRMLYAES